MANELSMQGMIELNKSGKTPNLSDSARLDVAGEDYIRVTQTIGTSEEALDIGDITDPGVILIINHDPTNYVSIRPGSGENDLVRIRARSFAMFELESSAPYAIADTADCLVEYLIIER